ncbi:hypothetical protein ACFE04_029621 [Oxalis oulophora]
MASLTAVDALSSLLLKRLTPSLSLPTRRSHLQSPPATCPINTPISLSDPNINDLLLTSASQLGFFQLTNHSVPPELARSAELDSLSLFQLSKDEKQSYFPINWPLGYHIDEEDETESFCLDTESPTELSLSLSSLKELARALEKIGLKITEVISKAVGFENPLGKGEDPTRFKSMMWVHDGEKENPVGSGGFYPYIVGLHYQVRRSQKYSLLGDSGWVSVMPEVDSVLVTIGDIAQVWSNGKLSKVRGLRPVASFTDNEKTNNNHNYTMSLLLTLPIDTDLSISPLLPNLNPEENDEQQKYIRKKSEVDERRFGSFGFEDYAWRVFHQPRLQFKDPLDRYRI